jgi:hypothetical protein
MEPIFIRARSAGGKVATFPISAFGSLEHTTRGNVYAVIHTYIWPLAECRSEEEACDLEEAILREISASMHEYWRLGDPTIPACILDLNEIAAGNLAEIRDGDAGKRVENREMD